MDDAPPWDRDLRRLTDLTKPLGLEAGFTVLLFLVHQRYESIVDDEGMSWLGWLVGGSSGLKDKAFLFAGDESGPWGVPGLSLGGLRDPNVLAAAQQLDGILESASEKYGMRRGHQLVFERILEGGLRAESRAIELSTTHADVARLMVAICGGPLGRVLDPAAGFGTCLLEAGLGGAEGLEGWDIDERALAVVRMRAELAGVATRVRHRDSLIDAPSGSAADTVLLAPPWGQRPGSVDVAPEWGWPASAPLDLLWLLLARRLARRQAVVHSSFRGLRLRGEGWQYPDLLDSVQVVVGLPRGARAGTGLGSALVLLDPAPRDDVLMLRIESETRSQSGALDADERDAVLEKIRAWRSGDSVDEPGLARSVLKKELWAKGSFAPDPYVGKGRSARTLRPEPAGHLIRAVELENVKAFGRRQRAELAPITLVYGPNAAGKSTILQSLMLLKQSLEEGAPLLNGSHARLGGLATFTHRHQMERRPSIRIEMQIPARWDVAAECFSPAAVRSLEVEFALGVGGNAGLQSVGLGAGSDLYRFRQDDAGRWNMASADATSLVETVGQVDKVWRGRPDAKPLSARRVGDVRRILREAGLDSVTFSATGFLPGRIELDLSPFDDGRPVSTSELAEASLLRAGNVLDALRGDFERLLREMAYLGPIRSAPRRTYERGSVNRLRTLDPEGSDAANYLFDHPSEAREAGDWLKRLKIPYSITVHPLDSIHPGVGDVLHLELADQRFEPPVPVSPADVGFGVSQILPLVVQLLAARDQVICIEQPEIHLHPRLQAEFAELLIQVTALEGQANQVIVETHSEHLMLRLQRRIREGQIDPEDVAVLYVDINPVSHEAVITRLRIDSRGRFRDRWPGGFFEERYEEVFGGATPRELPPADPQDRA